jgi:hypothetical protein
LWGVLAARAGGREEGTKRSDSDGVALPFYIGAIEVGDGPVSGAAWKEEGGTRRPAPAQSRQGWAVPDGCGTGEVQVTDRWAPQLQCWSAQSNKV